MQKQNALNQKQLNALAGALDGFVRGEDSFNGVPELVKVKVAKIMHRLITNDNVTDELLKVAGFTMHLPYTRPEDRERLSLNAAFRKIHGNTLWQADEDHNKGRLDGDVYRKILKAMTGIDAWKCADLAKMFYEMVEGFETNNFKVYHKSNPDFRLNDPPATVDRRDYKLVATVKAKDLSKVFELTNHIDRAWFENSEVKVVKESRSTSVGDVVKNDESGELFICAPVGWSKVEWKYEDAHKGFTKAQLTAAFDKVKDPHDWRNPIYRRVWNKKLDVTVAAIEFFTGAEVRVAPHPSGNDHYVQCNGYRNGPCGP